MGNPWGRVGAAIVIAYLIFTTIKGNLRAWLEIIGLKPPSTGAAGPSGVMLRGRN